MLSRDALLVASDRDSGSSTLMLVRIAWTPRPAQRDPEARRRAMRAAAETIGRLVPDSGMLVSYSENTFAIRLNGGRTRVALNLAKRILAAFERPLSVERDEIGGTPSIGIAAGGSDAAAHQRDAEAALDVALASGSGMQLFNDEIARALERHATIERNLRHAVLDERVRLAYQPIVSLRSASVTGAEALMRWDCPGLGPVAPAEFIAVAEESRAILRLGEWVLREACAQNRRWQLAGLPPIRITVNVSAVQIAHPDFMRVVSGVLESTSLAPPDLEIELTGAAMVQNELTRRTIAAVRRLGAGVAINEFGAGYSSLRDLGVLPVDTLKLARPFVGELGIDPFAGEAARAAVRLAHLRGVRVVGVGVEDAERLEMLRAIECDEAQGFLLGEPSDAVTFAARLERGRLRTSLEPAARGV